ncbi:MAG: hypothetical protein M1834_000088 [Cirrosporium novae-zelandiae]|nr:MAG: hypothetical protein M1834_000088 [Cirrosporium novae-zelandiae]
MVDLNSIPPAILAPLALIGAFTVLKFGASFCRMISSLFILPGIPLKKFGSGSSYALITGATDGIGLEFAHQLARSKFNLLLISRTQSRLDEIASTLQSQYNISVKVLAVDFSAPTSADWSSISSAISDLNISILINNVGRSHSMPVPFAVTPADEMHDIIEINCTSTLKLTQLVLPRLLARGKKNPSLILTIASFAGGVVPTPLLATYSGSKAFLTAWSQALSSELAANNITVEVVHSYLVTSKLSKIRRPSLMIPPPKAFVKSVLGKIGRSGGAGSRVGVSTPYWSHGIMQWGIDLVGRDGAFVVDTNRKMHEDIRRRALRKMERESGKKGM